MGYSTVVPPADIPALIRLNTLVDEARRNQIFQYLQETEKLEGSIAEVGVYKGGTTLLLGSSTSKTVYSIDTFEGLPQENEHDNHHKKGDFSDTSKEHVENIVKNYPNVKVIKAWFPKEKAELLENEKFSLVHLDMDLHESTKECLEFFYPKMVSGGIIVFDDYSWMYTVGVKKAVDDFLLDKPEKMMGFVSCQAAFKKV